jgi:DNA-binding beta-propeller fold protein YncE
MKQIVLIILLLFAAFLLTAEVKNPDKPLKGEWDLKPEKIWTLVNAGDDIFAKPIIEVSEDGTCYIYDFKTHLNYIFDSKGNFKKAFGKVGEGPGEIKMQMLAYRVNDKIIIADRDKLHYFSKDGIFINSVKNDFGRYLPRFFIEENKFISTTWRDRGEITYVDLESGKKNTIGKFSYKDKEIIFKNNVTLRMPGLHSEIIFGYDYDNKRIYYGINNSYTINIVDLNGVTLKTFSVKREKKIIPKTTIIKEIALMNPDIFAKAAKEAVKDFPGELKYFNQIQINKGLVYVFAANIGSYWDSQQIDIFSLEGIYLYRTSFKPGEDSKIYFPMINNILIKNNHLYVVLEDDNGEVKIVKYKILLPEPLE